MAEGQAPYESEKFENEEEATRWPRREFPMGKGVAPTNTGTALGSKNNPPSTEEIPDSSDVPVEREGEGFDPRNS